MKILILSALFGLSTTMSFAQKTSSQWVINGEPIPGATSVSFVTTYINPHVDSVVALNDSITYKQIAHAGKMLHRYKRYHIAGNVLQILGVTGATINLIEMNRTNNPVSGYIPIYAVSGSLALAGYILNEWVCPGFIVKAGMSLQGNCVNLDLDKRRNRRHKDSDAPEIAPK